MAGDDGASEQGKGKHRPCDREPPGRLGVGHAQPGDAPGATRGRDEASIAHPKALGRSGRQELGATPGDRITSAAPAHTVTRSTRPSYVASPTPATSLRSSTELNPPFCSR
ncbi:hypothetical protein ACFPRL_06140 [Pseudoclavibacter helvolus]